VRRYASVLTLSLFSVPLFVRFDWRMSHLSSRSSHEKTSEMPLSCIFFIGSPILEKVYFFCSLAKSWQAVGRPFPPCSVGQECGRAPFGLLVIGPFLGGRAGGRRRRVHSNHRDSNNLRPCSVRPVPPTFCSASAMNTIESWSLSDGERREIARKYCARILRPAGPCAPVIHRTQTPDRLAGYGSTIWSAK
jgi:hypothetical protein